MRKPLIVPLLWAALVAAATAQCPQPDSAAYPATPAKYPMTSNRYTVQYQIGNSGTWTNAQVYITYYGATDSSPFLAFTHYTMDTSMSFVSIPASAGTAVALRVTKLWGANFPPVSQVTVRPGAKEIHVDSASGMTVQVSTNTAADFAGDQFVLWWNISAAENSAVQGLGIFLDPPYTAPTGGNVKTIVSPTDLTGDLSPFDTLSFQGTVAVGGTGDQAFVVPANIVNLFFAPGSWLQGKLRFAQGGGGVLRRTYGPGVLDASRFNYRYRFCGSGSLYPDEGYESISFIAPSGGAAAGPAVADRFIFDGLIATDNNFYATDYLSNATVNNMKIIGWNANNDGFQMGSKTSLSNVFVRTADDSLKMWGSYITVTNATVWQNWNGGVINLGWYNNSPGNDCLIDGVYVVKTDWYSPTTQSWTYADYSNLNSQNNAIVASMMIPGTNFGAVYPSLYRNIYVEDAPRVLFSLKILPSQYRPSTPADLAQPGVLKLNLENIYSPASLLQNPIGFQNANGSPLTGSIDIGLTNVMLTQTNGTVTALTSANAAAVGQVITNGSNVNIQYGGAPPAPAPAAISAIPPTGSAANQVVTFVFDDPNGWQNLSIVNFLVNAFLDGRHGCYVAFQPTGASTGSLMLVDDAGDAGGPFQSMALPGTGSVNNSQCSISGVGSSVVASGNYLWLTLSITFSPGFSGNKVIYAAAGEPASNSGWQAVGAWLLPAQAQTTTGVVGMSPDRGTGLVCPGGVCTTSIPVTFTVSDTKGTQDLGVIDVLVNNFLDGRQACYMAYSRPLNVLYLVNDAGTGLLPGQSLSASGTLANSQCAVTWSGTPVTTNGNHLTLHLTMVLSASFAGNRVVYLAARDVNDANNTGWQAVGTWLAAGN